MSHTATDYIMGHYNFMNIPDRADIKSGTEHACLTSILYPFSCEIHFTMNSLNGHPFKTDTSLRPTPRLAPTVIRYFTITKLSLRRTAP